MFCLSVKEPPCVCFHLSCLSVYSCALLRDILLQGRLYISRHWLCFYANLFGKDIKVGMTDAWDGPYSQSDRQTRAESPVATVWQAFWDDMRNDLTEEDLAALLPSSYPVRQKTSLCMWNYNSGGQVDSVNLQPVMWFSLMLFIVPFPSFPWNQTSADIWVTISFLFRLHSSHSDWKQTRCMYT